MKYITVQHKSTLFSKIVAHVINSVMPFLFEEYS